MIIRFKFQKERFKKIRVERVMITWVHSRCHISRVVQLVHYKLWEGTSAGPVNCPGILPEQYCSSCNDCRIQSGKGGNLDFDHKFSTIKTIFKKVVQNGHFVQILQNWLLAGKCFISFWHKKGPLFVCLNCRVETVTVATNSPNLLFITIPQAKAHI